MSKKKLLVFVPTFPALTETFIEREISKLSLSDNLDVFVLSLKSGSGVLSNNLKDRVLYSRVSVINIIAGAGYVITRFLRCLRVLKIFLSNKNRTFIQNIYLFIKVLGYSHLINSLRVGSVDGADAGVGSDVEVDADVTHSNGHSKGFDFLLAHFMSESSTLFLGISIILNIPLGISAHAKDILQHSSPIKNENAELLCEKVKYAKFVMVCNVNALNHLKSKCENIDTSNCLLQYHGLDFEEILSSDPGILPEKNHKPIISSLGGRLVEKKGHTYLIQASKILKDRNISHQILIGGPGDLFGALSNEIKELGVEDTVKILGEGKGIPFKQILGYYHITDIFVFPSINAQSGDADGIANVLVEASAFRIPIVATDAGSTQDLIEDSKTGIIVPQKDPKALADGIQRLLEDKRLSSFIADNAYNRAKNLLNLNVNVKEIERLVLSNLK